MHNAVQNGLNDGLLVQSQIQATALKVPDELDSLQALEQALRQQELRYREAPRHEVMAAIRRGEVRHTQILGFQGGCNRILRGFYQDFFARLQGSSTAPAANQTLYLEYFAVGTSYATGSFTDTALGNEIYRVVPDELYEDGISTFYATCYFKKADGNPTGNTTVSSSTSTEITVADATGFVDEGRIQVETANNTYNCTIDDITSNVITVKAITGGPLNNAGAFDASDIPQANDTVQALHSEAGCFLGGAATSSPDTGTLMNRKRLQQLKNDSISLLYDYILACTSVE